jgi:hypothetical protein
MPGLYKSDREKMGIFAVWQSEKILIWSIGLHSGFKIPPDIKE